MIMIIRKMISLLLITSCSLTNNNLTDHPNYKSRTIASFTQDYPYQQNLVGLNNELRYWEIRNTQGVSVLPDIFYADDLQNEQAYPTTLMIEPSGRNKNIESIEDIKYKIDQLIYPTIGNPLLHVKEDKNDYLMIVMRIDKEIIQDNFVINYQETKNFNSLDQEIQLEGKVSSRSNGESSELNFYLLPRDQRTHLESEKFLNKNLKNLNNIVPHKIFLRDHSDIPEKLAKKLTFIFYFSKEDINKISDGFYDLRFEFKSHNKEHNKIEFQYNAVRIFDQSPKDKSYSIINITDTQVSYMNSHFYEKITLTKFKDFLRYINKVHQKPEENLSESEKIIKKSHFITFNGDLHNGGNPFVLKPQEIAMAYMSESKSVLKVIRQLPIPIFLTTGNHDGHANMGHAPLISVEKNLTLLKNSILSRYKILGEEKLGLINWQKFKNFLQASRQKKSGYDVDLYQGRFVQNAHSKKKWQEIDEEKMNFPLYDGLNQWRKTYGPLYFSFSHGDNYYINLNSYDLRQHQRSGWGLYIMNYGGGLSDFQLDWIKNEISRAKNQNKDIILLAHHDPRGGHNGEDYPFLFRQLPYRGISKSIYQYSTEGVLYPFLCPVIPKIFKGSYLRYRCRHDGLQDWMRPDPNFDCLDRFKESSKEKINTCNQEKMSQLDSVKEYTYFRPSLKFNNLDLLKNIIQENHVRTILLGHTHAHSLEIFQAEENILTSPQKSNKKLFEELINIENADPMRNIEEEPILDEENSIIDSDERDNTSSEHIEHNQNKDLQNDANQFLSDIENHQEFRGKGPYMLKDHELIIIRTTSIAQMTGQKSFSGGLSIGFSVFDIYPNIDNKKYHLPQINTIHFYQSQGQHYRKVKTYDIPRSEEHKSKEGGNKNLLKRLFW